MFKADADGLATVLRGIPEYILVVDGDGHIRYLNRAEPGYDAGQFVGVRANEFLPPESEGRFDAALDALATTGEPQDYELEVTMPDGVTAWYQVRMSHFETGAPASVVLVATNVTELRNVRADLARLRKILPICSWCDKIQNADGEWKSVEAYLSEEEHAAVSHGLCRECYDRQMEGLDSGRGSNGDAA